MALPTSATAFIAALSKRSEVRAILLGGSRAVDAADVKSDIDLYVCADVNILAVERAAIIRPLDHDAEIDNPWYGPEDTWTDAETDCTVDIVYWRCAGIEPDLRRVIEHYQPSLGYTSALWFTVRHAIPLYQRDGWFTDLQ